MYCKDTRYSTKAALQFEYFCLGNPSDPSKKKKKKEKIGHIHLLVPWFLFKLPDTQQSFANMVKEHTYVQKCSCVALHLL